MGTYCEEGKHKWRLTEKNSPFRVSRMMSSEPIAHVTCENCNARTWMTEPQFKAQAEKWKNRA